MELVEDGRGDPRFLALLGDLWELHKNRSTVYGTPNDPLANIHNSEPYKPHVGVIIEGGNIRSRIVNIVRDMEAGKQIPLIDGVHPIRNAELDNAAYSLIGLVLFEEEGLIPPKGA